MSAGRRPRWMVAAFALAVGIAVLLGGHALWRISGMERAANAPVEGWMTPKFIVHAYDVAPGDIAGVLGLAEGSSPRETLDEIAERLKVEPAVLVARVQELVTALQPKDTAK